MIMRRRAALPLAALLLLSVASAHADLAALRAQIDGALAAPELLPAHVGVLVVSLDDGRVIYQRNADKLFLPASNMKLFTAAAALDLLGPEFRFTTRVEGSRPPDANDGIDLLLRGSGDPTLTRDHLAALAQQVVREYGKTSVRSLALCVAGGSEPHLPPTWEWDDLTWYYAAETASLMVDRGTVEVTVSPGASLEAAPVVDLGAGAGFLSVENRAVATPPRGTTEIRIERGLGNNTIYVSGTMALDAKPVTEEVTVRHPDLYAAHIFRRALLARGVTVDCIPRRADCPDHRGEAAAEIRSEPLAQMLAAMNQPSDNYIAEALFRTLGRAAGGDWSWSAGAKAMADFLKRVGIDPAAMRIVDGSGLSRQNAVSPRQVVKLLAFMARHKDAKLFMESLPAPGGEGTLSKRMKGGPAAGALRAKTGTLTGVSNLSGCVTNRTGERLAFCFMANGHLCPAARIRAIQDRIAEALAGSSLDAIH